jgi:hypothetical protein
MELEGIFKINSPIEKKKSTVNMIVKTPHARNIKMYEDMSKTV